MVDLRVHSGGGGQPGEAGAKRAAPARSSKSMHEGVAVWCDCCSCAAEPYWVEAAEEMGVDVGSDYEE